MNVTWHSAVVFSVISLTTTSIFLCLTVGLNLSSVSAHWWYLGGLWGRLIEPVILNGYFIDFCGSLLLWFEHTAHTVNQSYVPEWSDEGQQSILLKHYLLSYKHIWYNIIRLSKNLFFLARNLVGVGIMCANMSLLSFQLHHFYFIVWGGCTRWSRKWSKSRNWGGHQGTLMLLWTGRCCIIHSSTEKGRIMDTNVCKNFLLASLPTCTFKGTW